jgi:purine-nucleoside phosphorylase
VKIPNLNAIHAGKKALGIFTVSDHILRDEATTPEERQNLLKSN